MIFQMVARKVFGAGYDRLKRALAVWAIVFWGIRIAGWKLEIAPSVLYLMTAVFTAGVMWQALSSEDNAANMMNLFMLPFRERELVLSYVSALGLYTLSTKTLGLLCVVWAVSARSAAEVAGSLFSAAGAVCISAWIYAWRSGVRSGREDGACAYSTRSGRNRPDAYAFCRQTGRSGLSLARFPYLSRRRSGAPKKYGAEGPVYGCGMVWIYLARYLAAHGNYMLNTVVMWGVACGLPVLLGRTGGPSAMSAGFVIVSMNTPVCILLSCNPALEQAVRFLPGQKTAFCIPYGLFIFLCHTVSEVIFLCSWQILFGGVSGMAVLCAICTAAASAAGSVLLEWFCPVRRWKIESDLWHHPRKYIVPGILLLAAVFFG